MRLQRIILLLALSVVSISANAQAPKWKVELDEPVKSYEFVDNGKSLFLANGKYAWGYDAATGAKKWDLKVNDYNKKGPHQLVGDSYLVSNDDKVQFYNAITGKLTWEHQYKDVDQDDFMELSNLDQTTVLRYSNTHIGVDLATGNELWRADIRYNQKALEKAGYNYSVSKKYQKLLVFSKDNALDMYDVRNGKLLAHFEDCEPNYDVGAKKKEWSYKDESERYELFILDGSVAVIDLKENKMVTKHEMKVDEDRVFIVPTVYGAAVVGKKEVANFRFEKGTVSSVPIDISAYRSFFTFRASNKDIAMISMDGELIAIDLTNDKQLWKDADMKEIEDGYAHRLIKQIGDNAIFTFAYSSMGQKSRIHAVSVNLITGKINYDIPAAKSDNYFGSFMRAVTAFSLSMNKQTTTSNTTGKGKALVDPSFDNIGFSYETFDYNGNIIIAIRSKATMRNPETNDRGGEGFVSFNPETGAVAYKDYFRLADDGVGGADVKKYVPQGNVVSNGKGIVYLCGKETLVAFDLTKGKRLWTQEKLDGKPTQLALIDGTLYVQIGAQDYDVVLQKNSIKFDKYNDDDPYGFAAVDPATGNIVWRIETKHACGVNMPNFSIMNYYNPKTKQLYLCDDEKLYALKLTRESKGAYDWTMDLDDAKIGEMPYKKTYAVTETFIGTKPSTHTSSTYLGGGYVLESTSTYGGIEPDKQMEFLDAAGSAELSTVYTSFWGNIWGVSAKRCLRIVAANGSILALGTKGASLIDGATGKQFWKHEYDYDQDAVQYTPRIVGKNLVYSFNRQLACVNLETGKTIWQTKEGKKSKFFTSPDDKYLFSINEEVVSGYDLQ